jgi:hypothetical protein
MGGPPPHFFDKQNEQFGFNGGIRQLALGNGRFRFRLPAPDCPPLGEGGVRDSGKTKIKMLRVSQIRGAHIEKQVVKEI